MPDEIDTFNRFGVSMFGGNVVLLAPPLRARAIPPADALALAAWIVALADPAGERFPAVLDAVRNT